MTAHALAVAVLRRPRRSLTEQGTKRHSVKRKLLIVDDDESLRPLLAGYFRRAGYEVEERDSAEAALPVAQSGQFDCFIFDVTMQGMTGLELMRRLRERGIETPAMFLTAHGEVDDKVAGFAAGADDYLGKPFDPREL